jgi:TatD DNase family protein
MPDTTPELVDYHCHLDLYPDLARQFAKCSQLSIATLAVTTTPKAWPKNKELAAHSPYVRVGLGLHPQLVAERENELALWEKYLPETRYVGEIGLDAGPGYYSSYATQKRALERILRICAEAGGKILSIHAVRSVRDVLKFLELHLPAGRGQSILHWFTGTRAEAERANALGCYFSINHQMLDNPNRAEIVASLQIDRILTETDGPFTLVEGKPAQPIQVAETTRRLSKIFGFTPENMRTQILRNLAVLERK